MKKAWFIWLLIPTFMVTQGCLAVNDSVPNQPSGLPAPPVNNVPRPNGKPGNLVVLNWAGFSSALSYTFDDAQPSHIAHYNELHAIGVPMTFYISSNVKGSPNSDSFWNRVVKDGNELGNHTASHPHSGMSGSCFGKPAASPEAEVDECTRYIIDHFGQSDVWTMASPFGETGWESIAESRFFLNRRVGGGSIAPNDQRDPWSLPCYMAGVGEKAARFNQLIDSTRSGGKWLILLFHSIGPTKDNWYNPVDIGEITQSIKHAQSSGDIWIDTVVAIGAYWMGQELLSAATPVTSGEQTIWTWKLPDHFPPGKLVRVKVDGGALIQNGKKLPWDNHGYYEVSLDEGSLTLIP